MGGVCALQYPCIRVCGDESSGVRSGRSEGDGEDEGEAGPGGRLHWTITMSEGTEDLTAHCIHRAKGCVRHGMTHYIPTACTQRQMAPISCCSDQCMGHGMADWYIVFNYPSKSAWSSSRVARRGKAPSHGPLTDGRRQQL